MIPPSTVSLLESDDRLQSLLRAFESRMHFFVLYAYQLVCNISPLPFEVTVLLVVFTYITVRELVHWRSTNAVSQTNGYVYWHTEDAIETRNLSYTLQNHLATALLVYITQKLWRERPLTTLELKNKVFTIHLLSLPSESELLDDGESPSWDRAFFDVAEQPTLTVKLPIYPCWTPVHEGELEMCVWIKTRRAMLDEAHRYLYLRVRKDETCQGGAKAVAALRRFVDNAMAFYIGNCCNGRDECKLMIYHVLPIRNETHVKSMPMPLAPTLDTVFFPQREAVKLQLQRFSEMQGRYAIKGFPHKLGFLLYGPRGTGKRSFLRALAYYTKRHIVRIPLGSLTKNKQLDDIFHFGGSFLGCEKDWSMLSSEKVIFLLEDVDSESKVVRARSSSYMARVRRSRGLTTCSADGMAGEEAGAPPLNLAISCAKRADSGTDNEDNALTATPQHPTLLTPPAPDSATAARPQQAPQEKRDWSLLFRQKDAKLDAINLSSLLNVLDGVLEDPGQITVMITDHPERLDPALLRPGRLAMHLRFDYIELDDLIGLCGLFFGEKCSCAKGALQDSEAAIPTAQTKQRQHSSRCYYATVKTDNDDLPVFPHERSAVDDAASSAATDPLEMNAVERSGSSNALLDWQRHDYQAVGTSKLDRRVIHQLSAEQAAQVRACIAALEKENAARSNAGHQEYNFFVTPSHVHHLCMRATTLEGFLCSLAACIRRRAEEA